MPVGVIKQKRAACTFFGGWLWPQLLGIAVIVLAVCARLGQLYGPTIMPDELGYWSAGAFFSGRAWSDVMPLSPYYSYGYGLVLAPLFALDSPVAMFRAAVALNALFVVLSFFVAQHLTRLLFPGTSRSLSWLTSLSLSVYSYLIYNSQGTQPDALMVLIYWLAVWGFTALFQKPSFINAILLALAAVFLFLLHMRNLGVIIALGLVLGFFCLARKLPWRVFLCFSLLVLAGLVLAFWFKGLYTALVWQGSQAASVNSAGGQVDKILAVFSPQGLLLLFCNVLGRLFYLGCSTFFLFYWAVFTLVKSLWHSLRVRQVDLLCAVQLLVLLAMLGEIGISCLFTMDATRMDHILYGRYNEQVLGPFLLMSLIYLKDLVDNRRFFLGSLMFHGASAVVLFAFLSAAGLTATDLTPASIAGTAGFWYPADSSIITRYTLWAGLFSTVIFLVIWALLRLRGKGVFFALTCASVCWLGVGSHAASAIFYSQSEAKAAFSQLAQQVTQTMMERDIYYVMHDDYRQPEAMIGIENITLLSRKFFFPDLPMRLVEESHLDSLAQDPNAAVISEEIFISSSSLSGHFFPAFQRGSTAVWLSESAQMPADYYMHLIDDRLGGVGLVFSADLTPIQDDTGQIAAGMALPAYLPQDDSPLELAKSGVRYVQITNRLLAEKMMEAGIPLELHFALATTD